MRLLRVLSCLVLVCAVARPAAAQTHYDFNVLYAGGGALGATLIGGSDDPNATNLLPLDDFLWTIQASGSSFWHVGTGDDFFPLMAFGVAEEGYRLGDFTFTLSRNGSTVFTDVATNQLACYVHLGTNTETLPTGLDFDLMTLSYKLTAEADSPGGTGCVDPNSSGLGAGDSHLSGLLPIFGAPEFSSGGEITFEAGADVGVVPEPATLSLMGVGLTMLGGGLRRRKR